MISKSILLFLRELKENNCKQWFDENRDRYKVLRVEFVDFINGLIAEIGLFDKEIGHISAKDCIFRINRDIRFSSDKSPYKTNFGAFIAKGGRNSGNAGYYLHIEPKNCFLAGGIYMPSPSVLKSLRKSIYDHFDEFMEMLSEPSFKKHFGSKLWGEQLKTAPQGYPKDFPGINFLRFKQFTVFKNIPDGLYLKPGYVNEILRAFLAMAPFNTFLNHAVMATE
ncbi:MAG: DUF2461 domain-containing protein [Bacteroidales bacterium]|nr:DUF2461 domain-containing protein [Bacteroidales bacterium]